MENTPSASCSPTAADAGRPSRQPYAARLAWACRNEDPATASLEAMAGLELAGALRRTGPARGRVSQKRIATTAWEAGTSWQISGAVGRTGATAPPGGGRHTRYIRFRPTGLKKMTAESHKLGRTRAQRRPPVKLCGLGKTSQPRGTATRAAKCFGSNVCSRPRPHQAPSRRPSRRWSRPRHTSPA